MRVRTSIRRLILAGLIAYAPTGARAQRFACSPIPGSQTLLTSGAILLLGEIYGTEQAPAPQTVNQLVCLALEHGLNVTVGLELPQEDQSRIDAIFDRPHEAEALDTLLAGDFWQRNYQDGRTSQAMLELIASLARSQRHGQRVRGIAIDEPSALGGRDGSMAQRVRNAVSRAPNDVFIILTGNLHNRLTIGTRFNPKLEPMGFRLKRLLPPSAKLIPLRFTHSGGSAWICTGSESADCGARELKGQPAPDASLGIELSETIQDDTAFSGRLHVGRITASPPARNARNP